MKFFKENPHYTVAPQALLVRIKLNVQLSVSTSFSNELLILTTHGFLSYFLVTGNRCTKLAKILQYSNFFFAEFLNFCSATCIFVNNTVLKSFPF